MSTYYLPLRCAPLYFFNYTTTTQTPTFGEPPHWNRTRYHTHHVKHSPGSTSLPLPDGKCVSLSDKHVSTLQSYQTSGFRSACIAVTPTSPLLPLSSYVEDEEPLDTTESALEMENRLVKSVCDKNVMEE